ncbi:hypothetical protein CS022_20690 [Veronia nyctiphanis]|uniref:Uncharacterized protein n=1 Tax=Veronia nyctiphanis TaxID=1278244 RepID=A0A4Q0YM67_9GAMM|nr:hypothetical protein [Veronia nyctiphanis]RXJ71513.1 hypothetical protein CS022_20690 [Veronia nyctiphanis]
MSKKSSTLTALLITLQSFCFLAHADDHAAKSVIERASESAKVKFEPTKSIPDDEIDAFVAKFETMNKHVQLSITGPDGRKEYLLFLTEVDEEAGETLLLFNYRNKSDPEDKGILIYSGTDAEDEDNIFGQKGSFTIKSGVFPDKAEEQQAFFDTPDFAFSLQDDMTKAVIDEEGTFTISAKITNGDRDAVDIALTFNMALNGFGDSSIVLNKDKREAVLTGTLGIGTYNQLKDVADKIDKLYLQNVPGSMFDDVNMHTGRLIREHKITTVVLSDSEVSSGGVDLFAAGYQRKLQKGGKLGFHSWCGVSDDGQREEAGKLDNKDSEHWQQLTYFSEMLGKEKGLEFYFYTLYSAPCDNIHVMSLDDVKRYGLATEIFK